MTGAKVSGLVIDHPLDAADCFEDGADVFQAALVNRQVFGLAEFAVLQRRFQLAMEDAIRDRDVGHHFQQRGI